MVTTVTVLWNPLAQHGTQLMVQWSISLYGSQPRPCLGAADHLQGHSASPGFQPLSLVCHRVRPLPLRNWQWGEDGEAGPHEQAPNPDLFLPPQSTCLLACPWQVRSCYGRVPPGKSSRTATRPAPSPFHLPSNPDRHPLEGVGTGCQPPKGSRGCTSGRLRLPSPHPALSPLQVCEEKVDDLTFRFLTRDFFQNNPSILPKALPTPLPTPVAPAQGSGTDQVGTRVHGYTGARVHRCTGRHRSLPHRALLLLC